MVKLPIALSKKTLLIAGAALLALSGIAAAAYAFWPAEPQWPRTPVARPKKGTLPPARAPVVSTAAAPQPAASMPEAPMDRLQRRLAEVLGGSVEARGGELRVTARRRPAKEPD